MLHPRPAPARRAARSSFAAASVASILLVAGCSGGGPEAVVQTLPPGTTTPGGHGGTMPAGGTISGTTVPATPGTATIDAFEVRTSLSCVGEADVELGVTYETTGASTVAFLVDRVQVPGPVPLSGTFAVPLSCDDRSHTLLLVAVDADGGTTIESRVVLTSTTPLGD